MRIWIAGAVVLFLTGGAALAQLQNQAPSPTPGPTESRPPNQESEGAQTKPGSDQRATEQAPFVIKIVNAEHAQEKTSHNTQAGPDKPTEGRASWTLSDRIATGAAVFSLLQVVALIVTVGVMMTNGRRQLRAYVFTQSYKVGDRDLCGRPTVRFSINNCGQTPARETRHFGVLKVCKWPLPEDFDFPVIDFYNGGVITTFPNVSNDGAASFRENVTDAQIELLRSESHKVFVFGLVEYRDVFKKKRTTRFCAAIWDSVAFANGVALDPLAIAYANKYNDTA